MSGDDTSSAYEYIEMMIHRQVRILQVMPFLWLGNSQTAHNKKLLVDLGITHVLNTALDVDNAFPELFVYSKISLDDSEEQEMDGVFDHAFKFINRVRSCGGHILVHCTAGVSRAATVVLGYIVQEEGQLLVDAYSYVRFLRPVVEPNDNFKYHLALLEMNCHEATSVAFHKAWKFYSYTQLKNGADDAWEGDGQVARKQGVGLFVMAVFRKLGVPKKRGLLSRFLDAIFSTYETSKNNQRMAAERIARAKSKHEEGKKGKGGGKKN
jgi:protein-tyrosine phosphatase